jgi:hypothetical protein
LAVASATPRVLHGKGNKARTAPLPSDAAEAVDRWLDCRKRLRLTGRHPLFCTLTGEPLWDSYVRTLCRRLAAKAGIEKRVHPHRFRHGWALSQVESGTSFPVIQQLLGHSSLATTATYVSHIAPAKAPERAAGGVEVFREQRKCLRDAEAAPEQHGEQRSVANAGRRAARAGGAQRLHVGQREGLGGEPTSGLSLHTTSDEPASG